MGSDENVERVARVIVDAPWNNLGDNGKTYYRNIARAVLGALTGAGES